MRIISLPCFGPEPDKKKGYPAMDRRDGARCVSMEVTGDDEYLNLSRFLCGSAWNQTLLYFDAGASLEAMKKAMKSRLRYQYNQAHLPVRNRMKP